jgi:ribosomal protein S18 acetylase RimI-like enzyme
MCSADLTASLRSEHVTAAMTVTIRQSSANDAESIGTLAAEFQSYLRAQGSQTDFAWGARQYLRDGFGEDPAFEGLVAEVDARLVAYALYHFGYDTDRGQRIVYLIDLFVSGSSRRHGIGEMLMRRLSDIGRHGGAELIAWSVLKQNSAAVSFYRKLGAKSVEEVDVMWVPI